MQPLMLLHLVGALRSHSLATVLYEKFANEVTRSRLDIVRIAQLCAENGLKECLSIGRIERRKTSEHLVGDSAK